MLFSYLSLAYDANRIHYDLPCARDVEGYCALVVHGPLIATRWLDDAGPLADGRAADEALRLSCRAARLRRRAAASSRA